MKAELKAVGGWEGRVRRIGGQGFAFNVMGARGLESTAQGPRDPGTRKSAPE
jgi:hypothetical protein